MKRFMKKTGKIALALLLVLTTVFGTPFIENKTEAANEQFTLGAIPTPRMEVPYTAGSTATVTNSTQFRTAYANENINRIVMANNIDITMPDAAVMRTQGIGRSLQIDGAGYTLNFLDTSMTSDIIFRYIVSAPTVFHLKDVNIAKQDRPGLGTLINGGNSNLEIILDNTTMTSGQKFQWVVNGGANINMFFRNTVNIIMFSDDFAQGIEDVIFENNSNIHLAKPADGAAVFYDDSAPFDSVAYFGNGCTADIEGSDGFPAFYPWKQFDVYPNADVTLHKVSDVQGVQDSYAVNQVYRIDSGATFRMHNGYGPALYDIGNLIDFRANSGANVEFIGNYIVGSVYFENASSKVILDTPSDFNFQNNMNAYQGFQSVSTTNPALQILNADIGAWNKNISLTGPPTNPSPFNNVSLLSGNTTTLAGSTAILNTMPGNWNTSNYARIAFATRPSVTANDMTLSINRTKPINPTYEPADANVSYVSSNTSIATVNSSGVVTGTGEGTTTIRVTVTSPEGITVFDDMTVTVTNNKPVLNVPTFTEVPLNSAFDPKAGVTATDAEDGNLINDVTVTGSVNTAVAGVYPLTYSVTDSDGNQVTANRVVLVNDGTYTAGTTKILHASNFTKRVGEVNTTPAAIKTAANVMVYNKTTGLIDGAATVNIIDDGGYTAIPDDYNIRFQVAGDVAAERTIVATVSLGDAPILTAPTFTEISVGGSFNERTDVVATDTEDDDTLLTSNVVVTGAVNTAVAGVYKLNYSVTDSDGNTATASQTVLVNDGSYTAGAQYILKATDFTKRRSLVDTSPLAIKLAASVKVYDISTGLENVGAVVNVPNTSGYGPVNGDYDITFVVQGDASATRTITATVESGNPPIVFTPGFTEINVGDSFDPKTGVTATDPEDGDFTSGDITVSGSVNTSQAGVYTLTYSVTDSDGNQGTTTRVVLVNDGTFTAGATSILQGDDFTRRISQVDTSDAAIKTAAGIKVYNKTTGLEDTVTGVTITDTGGYTNVVSDYDINFQVNGDTTAQRTIVASVIAGQPPSLNVPAFTEVALDGSFYPETGITATDPEDGNLIDDVLIDGSVDTSVAGLYILNYSVIDADGNSDTATQIVLVNDGKYKAGNTYILHGEDFEKTLGQVDTTPAAIKSAANIKVYSKATGLETNTPTVNIKNDGGYTSALGSYEINFEIVEDTTAEVTIVGKVITGELPILNVPSFAEISVGGTFDPRTGVTATDPEDGDLILNPGFVITNPVDESVAGVYTVEYSLTDSDSNTVTAEQVVLVNDGNYSAGASNILFAKDFTNRISQVDNSAAAIKADAEAKIYSKVTGVFIASATINVVDKGGYDAVEGAYDIVLEIGGDTATRTVTGTVIPGLPPELNVPSFTEINEGDTFDETADVSATDDEDGDFLIGDITITGNVDVDTPGVYTLTYSVTDSDGNTTTATQVVLVNDGTFKAGNTHIIRADDFTKRPSQVDTSDVAVKAAAGVEVYNKATGAPDTVVGVTLNLGGYTAAVDDYDITFTVTGDTGATRTIVGSVISGEPPVLDVPSFTEINEGDTFDETADVSATDDEDGDFLIGDITITGSVDVDTPGVYTLTYSVTDSDGNTTTATQVVLVNDGTFKAGNTHIIKADDFTKRVGQVDTSDVAVKAAAGVEVYNKITGAPDAVVGVTLNLGGYTAAVDEYDITFTVTGDTGATRTIIGSVILGEPPVLDVPSFTEINEGDTFDETAGVSATDDEDGDFLIGDITITGAVNTATAGVYTLNYKVTDSDGNETTARQVVLVNDGTFTAGTTYILQASDFTKRISEVDTAPSAIKAAAQTKVYDKETGAENVFAVVNLVDDGGYTATPDDYTISLEVNGDTGAARVITATVEGGEPPTISAPTFTEINKNDSFDPMTDVSATDPEDGVFADEDITVTGEVDATTAGVYTLNYSVTDSDGNEATARQVVLVNDGTFVAGTTHILQAKDFTKRVGEVDASDAAIKTAAGIKVYNKTTGAEDTVTGVTITDNGGYTATVGPYTIEFQVNGDTAVKTITATVEAGQPPVIDAPAFTEVQVNGDFNPFDNVTATDDEDGDLTDDILVDNSVDISVEGVYPLTYSVTDSDGNVGTATQVVLVNDGTFVAGTTHIIHAKDFEIGLGHVDTTPAAIKAAANAEVYSKTTGFLDNTATINITDDGGYTAALGTYTITFQVAEDTSATVTIQGEVVTGEIPTLTVPEFTEINVGGTFNPLAGVIAEDIEDGVLTPVIDNPVEVDVPGVYTVTYSITDSDFNTVTAEQIVLVNDGRFAAGNNFILEAADFTKRISEVDTSAAAIRLASGATVHSRVTGVDISSASINVVDKGGYQAVAGDYFIRIEIGGDPGTSRLVKASVVPGQPPVLTVPPFTEINKGDSFDPMTDVSAIDPEDTDITEDIEIVGEVDPDVAGVYTLEYSIVDSDGNTETATRVVLVNDGTFKAGNTSILKAANFTKLISKVDTDPAAIKTAAGVTVYNKATGEETVGATVNILNTNGYGPSPGSYNIVFEVAGDTSATRSIVATVTAGDPPVLTVPAFTEINKGDPFDASEGVTAIDTEDDDITEDIVITNPVDIDTADVYVVNYRITDSDGNTVTKDQVVLVNDGTFTAGNNRILKAEDFTKRLGEVDTASTAVKTAANVKVYSKSTGLIDSGATVNIKDDGGYTAALGDYSIIFEVNGDTGASRTITASVKTGQAPILTVIPFTEINVGDSFDPLTGVSVTDAEDGDLSSSPNFVVTNPVSTSVAGVYTVKYRITDSDSNMVEATQVVLINDGTFDAGTTHILQAKDFTKRVGEVNTYPGAIKLAANVKVYNKLTGAEDLFALVNLTDNGGYTAVPGPYTISFEVNADPMAQKTITATVETGQLPVLTAPTFTEITKGDAFDVMDDVTATDAEDDDSLLLESVVVTGTVNPNVAGVYPVTYTVTDSDGNTVTANRVILVNDGDFQAGVTQILVAHDFEILVDSVDTSDLAVKLNAGIQVYDKMTGLLNSSAVVTIVDDGGYNATVGTYEVTFEVSTDPGARRTIEITVFSDTPPVLTVPEFTEIGINSAFDPMTGVTAIDQEDGTITGDVIVSGTVDSSKAGIYTLEYKVTDADNNQVTARQIVLVNDGSFVYDNGYIISAKDFSVGESQANLTEAQMKEKAEAQVYDVLNAKNIENPEITVDRGSYQPKPGKYPIIFSFNPRITVVATVYDDGSTPKPGPGSTKTGDDSHPYGLSALFIIGIMGIVVTKRKKIKEN